MYVVIPWKGGRHALLPHQRERVEYDEKGAFLRIRNASTGKLNKCRVRSGGGATTPPLPPPVPSPPSLHSLYDLVGMEVRGTVARTGPDYVALLVTSISGMEVSAHGLVRLAKVYLAMHNKSWKVSIPRSWSLHVTGHGSLGPHVSLHTKHMKDVGKQVSLRITGVEHWTEDSRWVALELTGGGGWTDKEGWMLHMSCAQQPL